MTEQDPQGSQGPLDDMTPPGDEGPLEDQAPPRDEDSPVGTGPSVPEDDVPLEDETPPETEMPPGFDYEEAEDSIPPEYRILFPEDGHSLTKITETPPKMILPLVRMRIIDEAYNPDRTVSLLELFVREFDRRMISRDRKGRLEAVRVLQGALDAAADEDEASM
ncbi:hypothetical protein LCGC14_0799020 [marine sediment metagenome]|uniref:Uncharacterized protein n=1 Tax=marine sediment metagenome TaxID=412755 RepID=A0A0F9PUP0_9ZZZZ